jgi:hypothetical protein
MLKTLEKSIVCSSATTLTRFAATALVLFLFGCSSGPSNSNSVPPPPSQPAATPTFSRAGGNYSGTQTVTITSSTSGAIICWNTTGSPATNGLGTDCSTGTVLTNGGSINVSASETVYAVAGTSSLSDSSIGSVAYTIGVLTGSFGFQCANNDTSAGSCRVGGVLTWPATQAQPGIVRLWDTGVSWKSLNPSSGSYSWTELDDWLDLIAAKQPRAAVYTIGWTPYWDAPSGTCQTINASDGSPCPPTDLISSGSATFNSFISALVGHCSPNNHCVSTYIKYFELWNEPDVSDRWTGTAAQLYQMMAPAVTIIKNNVSGVKILSPPLTYVNENDGTYRAWQCSWLAQEVSNGILSDIYAVHKYWQQSTPENQLSEIASELAPNTSYDSTCSASGWTTLPAWLTETNYQNQGMPGTPYVCDTSLYSTSDCAGQIVRAQLLFTGGGSGLGMSNVDWYSWLPAVGDVTLSDTVYYYMMKYLVGGTLESCNNVSGTIWSCSFTEANGANALWIWTPTAAGTAFIVPSGYTDYRDLGGGTTGVTGGQTITIGPEPIMLEM